MSDIFDDREQSRGFDDYDLQALLDYPRMALIDSAPGGLNRLMRTVEAVQSEEAA